jgi:hypothetical protein
MISRVLIPGPNVVLDFNEPSADEDAEGLAAELVNMSEAERGAWFTEKMQQDMVRTGAHQSACNQGCVVV